MKVGIVGSEGAKFTPLGEARAKRAILEILRPSEAPTQLVNIPDKATHVVSGHCHLGGIDIWAEEVGAKLGLSLEIYPPKTLKWEGGYKQRNLQIAQASDIVYCIGIDKFPEEYKGMKFFYCYHCKETEPAHIKSGGCWTTKEARKLGKPTKLIIVENY